MHIIDNGKEYVMFTEISEKVLTLKLKTCDILFSQEIMLSENKQKARMVIVKKDEPSELISKRVDRTVRPANRAFIHTVDARFMQGQEILVGIMYDDAQEEVCFIKCMVMDIVPNGYLKR